MHANCRWKTSIAWQLMIWWKTWGKNCNKDDIHVLVICQRFKEVEIDIKFHIICHVKNKLWGGEPCIYFSIICCVCEGKRVWEKRIWYSSCIQSWVYSNKRMHGHVISSPTVSSLINQIILSTSADVCWMYTFLIFSCWKMLRCMCKLNFLLLLSCTGVKKNITTRKISSLYYIY